MARDSSRNGLPRSGRSTRTDLTKVQRDVSFEERVQSPEPWRPRRPATPAQPLHQLQSTRPTRPSLQGEMESKGMREATKIGFIPPKRQYICPSKFHGVSTGISIWDNKRKGWDRFGADNIMLFLYKDRVFLEIVLPPKKGESTRSEDKKILLLASLDWRVPEAGSKVYLERGPPRDLTTRTGNEMRPHSILYLEVLTEGSLHSLRERDIPRGAEEHCAKALESLRAIQNKIEEGLDSHPYSTWIRMDLFSKQNTGHSPATIVYSRDSFFIPVRKPSLPCSGGYPFLSADPRETRITIMSETTVAVSNESDEMAEFKDSNDPDYANDTDDTNDTDDADDTGGPSTLQSFATYSGRSNSHQFERPKPTGSNSRKSISPELDLIDFTECPNLMRPTRPGENLKSSVAPNDLGSGNSTKERLIESRLTDVEQQLRLLDEKWKLQMQLSEIKSRKELPAAVEIPHLLD
ncbi:hypothetical protein TWF506_002461 [Arthrobotrys conoides]|uniref:Uncharacterized protein n=1 Tax=Arthrobotrys conoides TaxID=74498 RepID=A0AAN8N556_9PEZI